MTKTENELYKKLFKIERKYAMAACVNLKNDERIQALITHFERCGHPCAEKHFIKFDNAGRKCKDLLENACFILVLQKMGHELPEWAQNA